LETDSACFVSTVLYLIFLSAMIRDRNRKEENMMLDFDFGLKDYDLCEACHLLPIMPWRFFIPARSINSHKTMTVKIPWKDHQSSHSLYVISLSYVLC
jgi:hypothetical protein